MGTREQAMVFEFSVPTKGTTMTHSVWSGQDFSMVMGGNKDEYGAYAGDCVQMSPAAAAVIRTQFEGLEGNPGKGHKECATMGWKVHRQPNWCPRRLVQAL